MAKLETAHFVILMKDEVTATRKALTRERKAGLSSVSHIVALVHFARKCGASPSQQREMALGLLPKGTTTGNDTGTRRFNCAVKMLAVLHTHPAMADIYGANDFAAMTAKIEAFFDDQGFTNAEQVNHWLVTGATPKAKEKASFSKRMENLVTRALKDGDVNPLELASAAEKIVATLGTTAGQAFLSAATLKMAELCAANALVPNAEIDESAPEELAA